MPRDSRDAGGRIAPGRWCWVRAVAALVCLVALGSCGDDEPEVKTGTWGGLGIELNVTGSGATVMLCCNGNGVIQEPLTPDASGHFKTRGTVYSTPYTADYEGTVSGDSMQLKITAYTPNTPGGVVIISPNGSDYRSLTYGVGFIDKHTSTDPPVGCVCGPCVGCPP